MQVRGHVAQLNVTVDELEPCNITFTIASGIRSGGEYFILSHRLEFLKLLGNWTMILKVSTTFQFGPRILNVEKDATQHKFLCVSMLWT